MIKIPRPLSVKPVTMADGAEIVLRQHGNPQGPRLIFCHGSGLTSDLYYPFWSLLASDFDLMIYDLRNHGQNKVTEQKNHNIPTFMSDFKCILEFIDQYYGDKPKMGVFHSISSLVSLMTPDTGLAAQVLFDPPLCRPGFNQLEFDAAAERASAMTRRRGERFKTREEFSELLSYLPPFSRVVSGVLELMAQTTLRPTKDEDYTLCCPKEYEAQILDYARSFAPLVDWDHLACPTKVVGGDPTLPNPYLPSFDFRHICTVDYDFLPESTHLLQLEYPLECATIVREFLTANDLL
ncbi:MAG: alpha/beta hydrolase [Bacteriovoracales bacterium]|nr:alpha/beta hydrolase [Bacteriovoracales bacterium]